MFGYPMQNHEYSNMSDNINTIVICYPYVITLGLSERIFETTLRYPPTWFRCNSPSEMGANTVIKKLRVVNASLINQF
jgi:hypothetical protein